MVGPGAEKARPEAQHRKKREKRERERPLDGEQQRSTHDDGEHARDPERHLDGQPPLNGIKVGRKTGKEVAGMAGRVVTKR